MLWCGSRTASPIYPSVGLHVYVRSRYARPYTLLHGVDTILLRVVRTRAQIKSLKESRLTIRGDRDQDPVASEKI